VSVHPTPEQLRELWRGGLAAERVRDVVRHLLLGCPRCSPLLAPELKALLGFPLEVEETQEAESSYDEVLDRVFAKLSTRDRDARGRIAWIRETLAVPSPYNPMAKGESPSGPPGFEALLDRCRALRFDDPARMADLARFATFLADRLEPRRYGAKRVADLRCRAWIELANAYRVADRLPESQQALDTAAECYLAGTAHELLAIRLLDVQASVDADSRRFPEALESLDVVHAVHLRRGDRHLAGRALLKKGLYAGYGGNPEGAVPLLRKGLALVDAKRDPGLVAGAMHNLAFLLVECGRLEEAKELLQHHRHRPSHGGRVDQLKVRWLEGRIEAGLGNLEPAAEILAEVCLGFQEADVQYKAALASLELAAVHLRQGRVPQARARALEAVEVFSRIHVERESLAALLVLRDAFERRIATAALLDGVIAHMAHQEREPAG
jgi:tetratricopeptide (TPR) repeat protein